MGMIVVETQGSFKTRERKTFSAMDGGHADAVAQAIEYLTTVQLPAAIRLDHELHEEGAKPRLGFAVRSTSGA
jgi:hypothetical protein